MRLSITLTKRGQTRWPQTQAQRLRRLRRLCKMPIRIGLTEERTRSRGGRSMEQVTYRRVGSTAVRLAVAASRYFNLLDLSKTARVDCQRTFTSTTIRGTEDDDHEDICHELRFVRDANLLELCCPCPEARSGALASGCPLLSHEEFPSAVKSGRGDVWLPSR